MSANAKLMLIAVLSLSLGAGACSSRRSAKKGGSDIDLSGVESEYGGASESDGDRLGDGTETSDVEEARIRGKEFVNTPDLATVQFEYDMYALSGDARTNLRENAAFLKENPSVEILVEGHCDDRGTNEYNLALGQKRAKAVRDYYIRLGVSGRRVATISFGEERPACSEANDACWLKNRRAITKIRAQVSSNGEGYNDAQ
jgi:peptidoglycan-associated lipoprotein